MNTIAKAILPQSLPEQIAQWLITEISEERLVPGQRVTEQYVAEQCRVSRGPVREAFREVEKLGLIQLLPRKGVVVTPLDLSELKELFEVRAALTRVSVCHIIDGASDQQLQELLEGARHLQLQTADEDQFFNASNALSDAFSKLGLSSRLIDMLTSLHLQILRYRHRGFSSQAARDASALGFLMVAEAIISRDKNLARATVDAATDKLVTEVEKAFKT